MRSEQRTETGFPLMRFFIVSTIAATLAGSGTWSTVGAQAGPSAEKAKAAVSRASGLPTEELTVVRQAPFGHTGIRQFKVMDSQGNVSGVDLDTAGRPVSADEMKRHAREATGQRFVGGLDQELADHLRGKRDDEAVRVLAWMDGVSTTAPQRGDGIDQEATEASLALIDQQVQTAQEPFVSEMQALGAQLLYRAQHVPMSAWEVRTGDLRTATNKFRNVLFFLEREHQPRLNISRVVVQADTVNARGLAGAGRRVGVVEAGRIAEHANLPGGQRINCSTFFGFFAGVSGHKTNVAGVIQSTNATFRGMAPGITILDGIGFNFSDSEMTAATDCVISNGADAVNMSFGTETNGVFNAFARYVDRKVYNSGTLIVPAVSNFCANRMGSPEIAFNVLAVGAFGDSNTTTFADDVAACTGVVTFSAFLDPISPTGDREEPDVVAPGHQIATTNDLGGFSNTNGTSFAAPHVTALVGLLAQRSPSLRFQGERVRAIVMAAARHNIEGATRLSERDGAGAILMAAADGVLLDGLSSFFSTPGGTTGFPIDRAFFAGAGQRVRVAVAWSHKSPDGDTLTRPTTDLDLQVRDPNGFFVAGSFSFDNTYEIVDFTAPVTGTYTATITNFRSSPGTEFIGFAASRLDF